MADFEPQYIVNTDSGVVRLAVDQEDFDGATKEKWEVAEGPKPNGEPWNSEDNLDVRKAQADGIKATAEVDGKKAQAKAEKVEAARKEAEANRKEVPIQPDFIVAVVPHPDLPGQNGADPARMGQ